MKRNRILGIAAVMALALTALAGASLASANEFKGGVDPEKLSGTLLGADHVLLLNEETFKCTGVTFTSEMKNKSATSLLASPEISNCSHLPYTGVKWQMNGCQFYFYAGKYNAIGGVDIFNCSKPMTAIYGSCVTEIGDQMGTEGLSSIEYKNVGSGSTRTVTVVAKVKGIIFTRSGAGCLGPKGTFSNGTYTGEWSVKGTSEGGSQAAFEIESTPEPPPPPPPPPTTFAVEEAPATISGVNTGTEVPYFRTIGGNTAVCKSFTLSGSLGSLTAEALTLTPVYKTCTVAGEAVPDGFVSAGGCSYAIHVNGTLDIVGATCATNPITVTRAGCVASIGPQSGKTTVKYTTAGSGKSRSVSIPSYSTIEGVTYTSSGPSCSQQGTFNTGRLVLDAKLTATNSKGVAQGLWLQ